VVIGHGHSPPGHGTIRISPDHFGKHFFRFVIFKGMQEGDGQVKIFLGCRRTGGSEFNSAEFLTGRATEDKFSPFKIDPIRGFLDIVCVFPFAGAEQQEA